MFSAVAERNGLDYDTAVKVAAGFGGGMYLGRVCGAVTGGIMAIGQKCGGADMAAQFRTSKLARAFAERFTAKHESIDCPALLGGVDLSKDDPLNHPEVFKSLLDRKVFARCPMYVRDAATLVGELLAEPANV